MLSLDQAKEMLKNKRRTVVESKREVTKSDNYEEDI